MNALRFTITCPRCAGELDHDPDTVPTRMTATLSSLALVCSSCSRRTTVVVSLIVEDDDECATPSTADPPN